MSDPTPLSSETLADIQLEDAEHDNACLAVKKPHPRDFGAVIFESANGPRWSILGQHEHLMYFKELAAYWRAKYEGLVK
jgi:hypothetical protein